MITRLESIHLLAQEFSPLPISKSAPIIGAKAYQPGKGVFFVKNRMPYIKINRPNMEQVLLRGITNLKGKIL